MALNVDRGEGVIIFKVITVSNIHENKGSLTFKLLPMIRTPTGNQNTAKLTEPGGDYQSILKSLPF